MIRLTLICLLFVNGILGYSQNIDAALKVPMTLELIVSNPQPRLQEKFQVSLDINYVRAHIFRSAIGKIKMAQDAGVNDNLMVLQVNATKKGKSFIGPLEFELNGTKYTTNKVEYEVVDALPNIDKGIWIRKVTTGDSAFCIIIEQRIPANNKTEVISEKETRYYDEPESANLMKFKNYYSVTGLEAPNASSFTDYGAIYDSKGNAKNYLFSYSITWFRIVDKAQKIIITKDKFENIPADFRFEDIVIQ